MRANRVRRRAVFGTVLAAALLAVALVVVPAFGDEEPLELMPDGDGMVFEHAGTPQPVANGTRGCLVDSALLGPGDLVDLDGSDRGPGLVDGSLGIKSGGSNGTPCSRTDDREELEIMSTNGSWYKVQLDLELKDNAWVRLTLLDASGSPLGAPFDLVTGSSIEAAGLSPEADPPFPYVALSTASTLVQQCANPSDSGPDNGPNDNCYWTVEPGVLFSGISVTTLEGEVSLEGGGDYDGTFDRTSKFFYTPAPDAVDDSATTNEDTPVGIDVLSNDTVSPFGGAAKSIDSIGSAGNGSVSEVAGEIRYVPDPNWSGTDSFTYVLSDGAGGTDQATVTVTVDPVNDAPVANDDIDAEGESDFTVDEDAVAVFLDVLVNDTDVDGDDLFVTQVTNLSNAGTSAVVAATGSGVDFTAFDAFETLNVNDSATVTFDYTASDSVDTDDATVTVTVLGVNDPPVPVGGSPIAASTSEETQVDIPVVRDVDDDQLYVECYLTPTPDDTTPLAPGVTSSTTQGNILFTPPVDFNGTYTLYCFADDDSSLGNPIEITVNVDVSPVNDDPVGVADAGEMSELFYVGGVLETSESFDVTSNDTDVDGPGPLVPVLDSSPIDLPPSAVQVFREPVGTETEPVEIPYEGSTAGTASIVGGEVVFDPAIDWPETLGGADVDVYLAKVTIPYTVSDQYSGSGGPGTDGSSLVVTVNRVVCSGETVSDELPGIISASFTNITTDSCKEYAVVAGESGGVPYVDFVPKGGASGADVYFLGELVVDGGEIDEDGNLTIGVGFDVDIDGVEEGFVPACEYDAYPLVGAPSFPTPTGDPHNLVLPTDAAWCWYSITAVPSPTVAGETLDEILLWGFIDPRFTIR